MKQRNNGIIIRLNDKELARLNAMVAKTKMTREAFIRTVLAGWLSVRELEKLLEETDKVNHKIVDALVPSKEKGGCQTWMRSAP